MKTKLRFESFLDILAFTANCQTIDVSLYADTKIIVGSFTDIDIETALQKYHGEIYTGEVKGRLSSINTFALRQ